MDIKNLYYLDFIFGLILYLSYNKINKYVWWSILIIGLIINLIIYYRQIKLGMKISFKKEDVKKNVKLLKETGFFDALFKIYSPLLFIGSIIIIFVGISDIKSKNDAGYVPLIIGVFCLIYSIYIFFKYNQFRK